MREAQRVFAQVLGVESGVDSVCLQSLVQMDGRDEGGAHAVLEVVQ